MPAEFSYPAPTLEDAIDGLFAYDGGCTDSGTSDPDLRAAVHKYLTDLDDKDQRIVVAGLARHYLSEEGVARGYGLADIVKFAEWMEEFLSNG